MIKKRGGLEKNSDLSLELRRKKNKGSKNVLLFEYKKTTKKFKDLDFTFIRSPKTDIYVVQLQQMKRCFDLVKKKQYVITWR